MPQRIVSTEIEIAASAECVWKCLADFASFPAWHPSIPLLEGEPKAGARLVLGVRVMGDGVVFRMKAKVLQADAPRELRWEGHLLSPRLFGGEHLFRIETLSPERVRFTQVETFRGALVWLLGWWIRRKLQPAYEASNRELKRRVEAARAG
jgi:hypothetical protein